MATVAGAASAGRAVAAGATVGLVLLLTGCAALSPIRVDTARTGETVVRVARSMSFEEVARRAYGDPSLAEPIARLAGLDPGSPAPGGTVLVLPPRDELESRLRADRQAEDLYRRGLEAADGEAWGEAADRFRRALELSPGRHDARYNLGLALLRGGDLEGATAALGAVAASRPDDAPSRYAFGTVLRRRRAWDRALGEFRAAADLDRDHAAARFAVARTLEDLGRDREAIREWERFLRSFADDALAASARDRLEALQSAAREETVP